MPDQKSPDAYDANLRDRVWAALGMSIK
jgi:hypothetical protein